MVAGLLKCSGAWTGNTIAADGSNPKGYFEHQIIREHVIKKVLTALGSDPLGVSSLPPLQASLEINGLRGSLHTIISREGYGGAVPWLYKDAKLSLIWPAFHKAFPEAQWVVVRRDPEQIIASCMRTPFMQQHSLDKTFWVRFVEAYLRRLRSLTDTISGAITLDADPILNGEFADLSMAIHSCGLEFNANVVADFVSPEYWHANEK